MQMKIGDRAKVTGRGYMYKGMIGRIVKRSERFIFLQFEGDSCKWPFEEKDLRIVK